MQQKSMRFKNFVVSRVGSGEFFLLAYGYDWVAIVNGSGRVKEVTHVQLWVTTLKDTENMQRQNNKLSKITNFARFLIGSL